MDERATVLHVGRLKNGETLIARGYGPGGVLGASLYRTAVRLHPEDGTRDGGTYEVFQRPVKVAGGWERVYASGWFNVVATWLGGESPDGTANLPIWRAGTIEG